MSAVLARAREIALTVGALGGLLCLLFGLASWIFGLSPLVVQSGSMQPTIDTGALLVAKDVAAAELEVGDVVTVPRGDGSLVTHRIVQITHRGDTASMQLKGDANTVVDPQVYDVEHAGRMLVAIPYAGRAAAAVAGPVGVFVLGLYVAFLVVVLVRGGRGGPPGRPGDGPPSPRTRGGRRKAAARDTATAVGAVLLAGVLSIAGRGPHATAAAWIDDASVGTSTLTAYTVPKPVWVSCTVTGGALAAKTVTIVWDEVSSPYALDYTASAGTVSDNGTTRQTAVTSALLGLGTTTVVITARLPSPNGGWVSTTLTQEVTFVTSLIASCGAHN